MSKQEVIERFCRLSAKVQERQFKHTQPTDCFCHKANSAFCLNQGSYRFSEEVMTFIEDAIEQALVANELTN